MTQTATCVALQPVDDAEQTQHLESLSSAIAQTSDKSASDLEEALLPMEEIAIASGLRSCDHHMIAPEILKKFRRGYGEYAAQATQQLKEIAVTSAEGILRKARLLLDMKLRLNRKEWGVWLREVLGWFGSEATPYVQIGKIFRDFDPAVFRELEPFTILKLRTKRYAPVVARLREELSITSNLIQNFIKEIIPKQARRKKAAPNYSEAVLKQRVNAEDGKFYFTLNANLGDKPGSWLEAKLEKCTVGQILEQAAALEQQSEERCHNMQEGLEAEVEQRVRSRVEMTEFALRQEIAELKMRLQTSAKPLELVEQTTFPTAHQSAEQKQAIALREQQKSPARPDESSTLQPEEQQTVVDDTCLLPPQNSSEGEELPSSERTGAEFEERSPLAIEISEGEAEIASDELDENLAMQVAALAKEQTTGCRVEGSNATNLSESAPKEAPAQPPEAVRETARLEPSVDASADDCQRIAPAWEQLKQLRGAEAGLRKIDNQIKLLNDKLVNPVLGETVKREVTPVLKKHQNLRSDKVSEIVELIDSNSISGYYEEVQNVGRVVLNSKYVSEALKQAKTWKDIVLVVAGDQTQLRNALAGWSMESKQLLVRLLTEYLETQPNAFDQIEWIPEKLLNKALFNLTFTLEKIRSSDNLVDEPEMEKICGCKFKSVVNIRTPREQWFFQTGNKVLDVFGRAGFAVEKF